ncbi:MAG: hypothetical protein HYX29_06465 [Solirubrobacterales bacterium]|nr:hypothetical protein [Solirubrobacterales bacterium]
MTVRSTRAFSANPLHVSVVDDSTIGFDFLTYANMATEINSFVGALGGGLILPEDF